MRIVTTRQGIRCELIKNRDDVLKIVRLAMAAGMPDIDISYDREDQAGVVDIRPPDDYASSGVAALVCVVAELNGTTPEKMIDAWRSSNEAWAEETRTQ